MHSVKGRFDGRVVVLDEPAPVDHEVDVVVEFPDGLQAAEQEASDTLAKRYGWERTRQIQDGYAGSVVDELIRQRRMD